MRQSVPNCISIEIRIGDQGTTTVIYLHLSPTDYICKLGDQVLKKTLWGDDFFFNHFTVKPKQLWHQEDTIHPQRWQRDSKDSWKHPRCRQRAEVEVKAGDQQSQRRVAALSRADLVRNICSVWFMNTTDQRL